MLLIDKAGRDWLGGNTYFTAGAFRVAHRGLDHLRPLLEPLPSGAEGAVELPDYDVDAFYRDLCRVTHRRVDPALGRLVAEESLEALTWLHGHGVRFELMFHRQAYEVDGRYRFWGGLAVGAVGGGKELVRAEHEAATRIGVELATGTPLRDLLLDAHGSVQGVRAGPPGGLRDLTAPAVVLACGGFEANPQMRAAHLGPGFDLALVRGTPYNTGDGILAALRAGAQAWGHWSGCHSVPWDAGGPPHGDRELTNRLTKNGYPFGILVDLDGRRFVDEGADLRNYTYARYGAEILRRPGGVAVEIFDAKVSDLLRPEEYHVPGATRAEAGSLSELAAELGIDATGLTETVRSFNAAVTEGHFDPTVKDGKATRGITPPKSNWALPLDTPPYVGYKVTCGVTFTYGGVRVDTDARVLDTSGLPIPGLFAAGELVGGVFSHNYPGGSGLTLGSVLGRRAGRSAAAHSASRAPA